MRKYLYLTKTEWVIPWVEGGSIPISLASTYQANVREGTLTPDENLIHDSPVDIASLRQSGLNFKNVRNLTFSGITINDQKLPNFENVNYYKDDGLILSFSNRKSGEICRRLGKVACVAINEVERLKQQLGVESTAADCRYTNDHQRNHFLKAIADEWQQEYRLFWPVLQSTCVTLPPGISRRIKIKSRRMR